MREIKGFQLCLLLTLLTGEYSYQQNLQSSVTVYVFPPASSTIFVGCWSNSTSSPFKVLQNCSYVAELTWNVISGSTYRPEPYIAYWCRARMGTNLLHQFPVYGGGLPQNSSEWIINLSGRRRLSFESRFTNDLKSSWYSQEKPDVEDSFPNNNIPTVIRTL